MNSRIFSRVLLIGLSGLMVIAAGCRRSAPPAGETGASQASKIAPSDVTVDGKEATVSITDQSDPDSDLAERDEIRRVYRLLPGSRVDVSRINGKVTIQTADIEQAEVLIVRSAKTRDHLQYRLINIEHQTNQLHIFTESDERSIFSSLSSQRPDVRQRVILKVPRKVDLEVSGVSGTVDIGPVDGEVEVGGASGEVKLAGLQGAASFYGINGEIEATIAKLRGDGISIRSVNGNTTLRFTGEVHADVEARGINGSVRAELPKVEQRETKGYGRYEMRIGDGGPRIVIRNVNGDVLMVSAPGAQQTRK